MGHSGDPEQRVQTSATHLHIPDVSVTRSQVLFERIVRIAPLWSIEILSWDDHMSDVQKRVDDHFAMGVTAVGVIDPCRRRAFIARVDGSLSAAKEVLTVVNTNIKVPLAEMISELNELEGRA